MRSTISALAFLATLFCIVSVVSARHRGLPASKWLRTGRAASEHTITFKLALHQRDAKSLLQAALDMSVPGGATYSQAAEWTNKEIAALVGITPQDEKTLIHWVYKVLRAKHVAINSHRDMLTVAAPVAAVEHLFGVSLHEHVKGQRFGIFTEDAFRVPQEIAHIVHLVVGLSPFEFLVPRLPSGRLDIHYSEAERQHYIQQIVREKTSAASASAVRGSGDSTDPIHVPNQFMIFAGEDFLIPQIVVMCKNQSNGPTNPNALCDNSPPIITNFVFNVTEVDYNNNVVGSSTIVKVAAGGPAIPPTSFEHTLRRVKSSRPTNLKDITQCDQNGLQTCMGAIGAAWANCSEAMSQKIPPPGTPCYCLAAMADCVIATNCQDFITPAGPFKQACQSIVANLSCSAEVSCDVINPLPPVQTSGLQCSAGNMFGIMQCGPVLANVAPNTMYNISYTFEYADGSSGDVWFDAENSVLTSPYLTPSMLQQLYSSVGYQGNDDLGNRQAVVEFGDQWYNPLDVETFLSTYQTPQPTIELMGPNVPFAPGGESSLDIQWILATGVNVSTIFYSHLNSSNPNAVNGSFLLGWLTDINGHEFNIANVWSISYGMAEDQFSQQGFGSDYVQRCEVEFAKLALRRVTLMSASGDNGASNYGRSDTCQPLHPTYPSSSSWVTSVGATFLTKYNAPQCRNAPDSCTLGEAYVRNFDGSGLFWSAGSGFSGTQPRPSWQDATVPNWLKAHPEATPTNGSVWNPNGRAYPDIATIGHNLPTYMDLVVSPVDGTSAACPIFAGLVSLLNAQRRAHGKRHIGFLTPLLYTLNSTAFTDITVGNSRGADFGDICPDGYQSTVGWDPVTGFGTPVFKVILDAVLRAP